MNIWFIDHDGKKVSKMEVKWADKIVRLTTPGELGGEVEDPFPSQCNISGDDNYLFILHTQNMEDWINYVKKNEKIYALFVSDETGGRVSSDRDDSLENAYFSVKYKFDTLINHPLFENLISAAENADNAGNENFKNAWKALKYDRVPLESLVIVNAMLSAGQALGELPQELKEAAKQAYEAKKREDDPAWDAFIKQDAEKRNRWLEEVI